MLRATTACTFSTSTCHRIVKKCSEPQVFFNMFTCKCALRHNGVHFFHISTSKSGPSMMCFVHLDLQICFAPQRRALFNIATSKSGPLIFYFKSKSKTNPVAKVATKPEFLVAKEKMLVALANISVTISSPAVS